MKYHPAGWIDHPLAHNHVVSHEAKFIYTYVPKAACTSLKTALLPFLDVEIPENLGDNPDGVHSISLPRVPPSEAIRLKKEEGYFAFAFIREPFERLTSFYKSKFFKDGRTDSGWLDGIPRYLHTMYNDKCPFHKDMTFENCVQNINTIYEQNITMEEHFRSQNTFLRWPTGYMIPDFIGTVKNFPNDIQQVESKLGLTLQIENLNTTRKTNLEEYYTPSLKKIVNRIYADDIDLYSRLTFGK